MKKKNLFDNILSYNTRQFYAFTNKNDFKKKQAKTKINEKKIFLLNYVHNIHNTVHIL